MNKPIFISIFLILLATSLAQGQVCIGCYENKPSLDFFYETSYDKTYCTGEYSDCIYNSNKLPYEGQNIVYWPNISANFLPEVNKTEDLILFYYLVNPSGKESLGSSIYIFNAKIVNGETISSPTSIGGIGVPSNYPGLWEIKSILLKTSEFDPFNASSFKHKYDEPYYHVERIHVLSYSEYKSELISKLSLFISFFAVLVALITGFVPIHRDNQKQISLLESLYSELEAISSKKGEINVKGKKIETEGNLQWVKELFGWELRPNHKIWVLNTQIYVGGINRQVKGKKTRPLKQLLIRISQKIELVENYVDQYSSAARKDSAMKEAILKVIEEVTELVDLTKNILEREFGIKE